MHAGPFSENLKDFLKKKRILTKNHNELVAGRYPRYPKSGQKYSLYYKIDKFFG